MNETITLTFSESAETHTGMEIFGEKSSSGFQFKDLLDTKKNFENLSCECHLYHLNELVKNLNTEDAYVLVIKNGASVISHLNELFEELTSFPWDQKYWCNRRKQVLNKRARSNVCFSDTRQEPDYENKKGTIIAYSSVPQVNMLRKGLATLVGEKGNNLVCEGNRYFSEKCGIGFHGDTERRRVIGVRIGKSIPIHWCWYYQSKAIGKKLELILDNGDIYLMSEKAVGTDCKKRNIYTLRHAAGNTKYLQEKR